MYWESYVCKVCEIKCLLDVKICLNYINVYFLNADGKRESILFLSI